MKKKLSTVFVPPAIAIENQILSQGEVDFFKTDGFLVKPKLLDAEQVASCLEKVWAFTETCAEGVESNTLAVSQHEPGTWRSPRWRKQPPADKTGPFEGRERVAIHGRTLKMHILGTEQYLLDLIMNNPKVTSIAKLLLGEELKEVERVRGVYALFPGKELSSQERQNRITGEALGPHTDRVCQQLNVCVYLDDVPARNGGFTLYPKSHEVMFKAHQFESNWSPTAEFKSAIESVASSIRPVEIPGQAGDVVFWHGRSVHSAGIHVGDRVRWAVFGDFQRVGRYLSADEHRQAGQFEWFKDTQLFKQDHEVTEDMWRGWRLQPSE